MPDGTSSSTSELLATLLLTEQRRLDPVAHMAVDPAGAEPGALLVAAAAQIASGQPRAARAALAALDGLAATTEQARLRRALDFAAASLDVNWFPGDYGGVSGGDPGGGSPPGAPAPAVGSAPPAPAAPPGADIDPPAEAAVLLAARVIPRIRMDRAIIRSASAGADGADLDATLAEWARLLGRLDEIGWAPGTAYVRILLADLLHRVGADAAAEETLTRAETGPDADDVLAAHAALVRGDWAAAPDGTAQTLGLAITPEIVTDPRTVDRAAAERWWTAAAAGYQRAGARAGRAAALLRDVGPPTAAGRPAAARARLEEAVELARAAGDGALTQLAVVHRHLEPAATGSSADLDELADWASRDGSLSYGRGLCRLLVSAADRLRSDGDIVPGRRLLRDAQRLADALGTRVETRLVETAVTDLFGGAYRLLGGLLALADTDRTVRPAFTDALEWAATASSAIRLNQLASGLQDPDLLLRSTGLLTALLDADGPQRAPDHPLAAGLAQIRAVAEAAVGEMEPLLGLLRGRAEREAGFADDARATFTEALAAAERTGNDLLRCLALIVLDRRDEALDTARELISSGRLDPDLAVDLLLRAGDAAGARQAWQQLGDRSAQGSGSERPWEDLGRQAEIQLALGPPDSAATLADSAVDAFEERLVRLARDTLQTDAADAPPVAAAYLTSVAAHTQLAQDADGGGDHQTAARERDLALDAADRARAGLVGLAGAVGRMRDQPGAREPVAEWLRAGSAWAAEVEQTASDVLAGGRVVDSDAVRVRVDAAEARLAAAEQRVAAAAPGILDSHRSLAPPVEVREALPADAVLLEYHSYDRELVVFVVTRTASAATRYAVPAAELTARVRSVHRSCSSDQAVVDEAGLSWLSEVLLAPARDALDSVRRVLVVPHRALTLVPWHVLPWNGGVLGAEHVVSCLPVAGLLPVLARRPPPDPGRGALVVGDPAFPPGSGLPALPGTGTEASHVGTLLGVAPLLGAGATLDAVRRGADGASIACLSTHGIVDERWPHLSYLALAGGDRLTIGDLMGTVLGCDLVVLSACRTGEGRATAGGDVIGLVRGALVAGTRDLLVSLWPVDDLVGTLFVVEVVARVATGVAVADAVHGARLRLRAMDGPDRDRAYEALRTQAGSFPAAPGARNLTPLMPANRLGADRHPFFTEAFVHIGVPG
jgi:CHAT domain-containing protein